MDKFTKLIIAIIMEIKIRKIIIIKIGEEIITLNFKNQNENFNSSNFLNPNFNASDFNNIVSDGHSWHFDAK